MKCFVVVFLTIYQSLLVTCQLQAVFVVLRHGDRAPTDFYPNDPFKDKAYWPGGIGEMNILGINRTKWAGQLYGSHYKSFMVNSKGWPKRSLSSSRNRAIQTAQIFLQSFLNETEFPGQQSIVDIDMDMLTTSATCVKASKVWFNWFQEKNVTDYIKSKENVIKYLSNQTGQNYLNDKPFTLRNLEFLSTTLEIERDEYKYDVPTWAKNSSTIQQLTDLKQHAFLFDWQLPIIQRLRVGLLLNDIVDKMVPFVKNPSLDETDKQRLFLYSTHDVNHVLLLQSMGLYEQIGMMPTSYSSSIVIELYGDAKTKASFIHIIYRQVLCDGQCHPLSVTGSQTFHLSDQTLIIPTYTDNCTFEQFLSTIRSKMPTDWNKECENHSAQHYISYITWILLIWLHFGSVIN